MSTKTDLLAQVHASIRKCTIDINQAENYFERSQYEGYENNLRAVIAELNVLVEVTKSKID